MQQQIAFAEKMRQQTKEGWLDSENFEAQQAQYRAERARFQAELDAKLAPLRAPPEVPIGRTVLNVVTFKINQ